MDAATAASTVSRRGFLRASAVGLARPAALVGSVAVAGSEAVRAGHFDRKPAHVDLTFDRAFLERYRPHLNLSAVEENSDDTRPSGLYGWKASSPEFSTDVAVFWVEYPYQKGLSPFGHDSHYGDHEPVYVFADRSTGDVREVVYSAYHWLRGRTTLAPMHDETHVQLSVVSPWHQYVVGSVSEGEYLDVKSLGDDDGLADPEIETEFESWLSDEKFHDLLAPGVCVNPWLMASVSGRQHWWAEGRDGVSMNKVFYSSLLGISSRLPGVDWGGASQSDVTE